MPRPRNLVPQPRNHKGSAVIDVTCGDGTRKTVTLGPWNSPQARAEYKRFLVGSLLKRAIGIAVRRAKGEKVQGGHLYA